MPRRSPVVCAVISAVLGLGLVPVGNARAADATLGSSIPPAPAALSSFTALADQLETGSTAPPRAAARGTVTAQSLDRTGCASFPVTTSGTGSSMQITINGFAHTFSLGSIPTNWWRQPPVSSPVFALYNAGLMWVGPVAVAAADTDDTATVDALVNAVVQLFAANPDTGNGSGGWDEGTNLRRQQALNCLWRVSGGNAALRPAIEATAAANLDMNRYSGLPKYPAHNHGLMANLALLDAGTLLDNASWRTTAIARMVRDSGGAWTPSGLSFEQSGGYSLFNVALWSAAADVLASYPDAAAGVVRIRADVARARGAHAHITAPNGTVVPYGDGGPTVGVRTPQPSLVFRDDRAGVATGRWSWTNASTDFYLLRFGGPRRMHGHQDRGSLVWNTLGLPVLVDPATFGNDIAISHAAWSRTAVAHNTQVPVGGTLNPGASVALGATSRTGPAHGYVLSDRQYGVPHTRQWIIDHAHHRVRLTDVIARRATTLLHLDSRWALATTSRDRHTVTLTSGSRRLTVASTGAITVRRGSTNPLAGWLYPSYGVRVKGVQLFISTAAGRSVTTMTVR